MPPPYCTIPADDREKLLRLYKRLQEFHTPCFDSPALREHAEKIKECIRYLEEQTREAGVREFKQQKE